MKKWKKFGLGMLLVVFIISSAVFIIKFQSNETLALKDFNRSDNGMQNYTEDVKSFAKFVAKKYNLDSVTVIHLIYLTSDRLSNLILKDKKEKLKKIDGYKDRRNLLNAIKEEQRQIFNNKEYRKALFNFAVEIAETGKNLGIANYNPKNQLITGLPWLDFVELSTDILEASMNNIKRDDVTYSDLINVAIADLEGDIRQSDRVQFGLSLFVNFTPYINSNLKDTLRFMLKITKQPLPKEKILRNVQTLLYLLNQGKKIKRGRNNSDIPLAIFLDRNGVNLSNFIQSNDLVKLVILHELYAYNYDL